MTLLAALNWHSIAFFFFALVTIGFAIAVVTTSNIVRMAFYLTLALGATSGLFFLAGAGFVISMHLLVVLIGASYMARTKRLTGGTAAWASSVAIAEPVARTVPRHRSFAVTAGIVSGIIVNALIGLIGLIYWISPQFRLWTHQRLAVVFGSTDLFSGTAASWLCAVVGILFLVNVL